MSKTVKSNVPCLDFGNERQLDINAILSVVEDFIKLGKQSGNGRNNAGPELSGESDVYLHNQFVVQTECE